MASKAVIAGRLPVRRGLDENEAAIYLSLSPSFFRKLVGQRRMPRPRLIGERRIGMSRNSILPSRRCRAKEGKPSPFSTQTATVGPILSEFCEVG